MLRASGVSYDIRRAAPYSIYDRFDFKVVTGTNGDLYDRYLVRLEEMRESVKILKQAGLATSPTGRSSPAEDVSKSKCRRGSRTLGSRIRRTNLATTWWPMARRRRIAITFGVPVSST